VLIFGDAITRGWKQIIQFHPEAAPLKEPARPRASRPERVVVAATGNGSDGSRRELVRDSRGVRMAREEQED
jgi:hypothetical protein